MSITEKENISNALAALRSAAARIRHIEGEARESLFSKDDSETYRKKLEEKTMLLMELSELIDQYCEGMTRKVRAEFENGLNSFERRAAQALELSSTFYMSTLLYPEDYREGDPNDLELFIEQLSKRYLP